MANEREDLLTLARLYGVQTSYQSAMGHHVEASPESLLGALRALQAPVEGIEDVAEALRERREELAGRIIEPVIVAWDGHAPSIELRPGAASGSVAYHLDLEGGSGGPRWRTSRASPRPRPPRGRRTRAGGWRCRSRCRSAITSSPWSSAAGRRSRW